MTPRTSRQPAPGRATSAPHLSCECLAVGYKGHSLLPAFDLTIAPGSFTLVVGRNGTGKSTWLKTVLGLIPPVSGRVRMAEPRPRLTYVPQAAALDAILPVRGRDVAAWGRLHGWQFLRPLAARADRVATDSALAEAEAEAFADQAFRELSGGQKQRILFARMLASDADVILLDEPTASMDQASEREAYRRLDNIRHKGGTAVIVVTHTISQVTPYADQLLFVDRTERARRDGEADKGAAQLRKQAEKPADRDAETSPGPAEFHSDHGVVLVGPPDIVCAHRHFQRHFHEVLPDGPA
ncbi:MAG: ATP-binding cassette domain-containing protein [Proteobacteria bacterium]|nr:ATP-binding cassette domain-containing protein [Pseudomonadota bacterium]